MKKYWICLFIFLLMLSCLIATLTKPSKTIDTKEPIIVDSLLAIDQLSGSIFYQENYITVDANWQESGTYIGDYYDWAWMVHFGSIAYLSFGVPYIPRGYELQSATIMIFAFSMRGNSLLGEYPIFDYGNSTIIPDGLLEHIDYGSIFNSNDIIPNIIYGTFTLFNQGSLVPPCWISYDVTDCLLSDISGNRLLSQFRIYLLGFSDWDNWNDYISTTTVGNTSYFYSAKIKYILVDTSTNNDPNNPVPQIKLSCYPNPFNPTTTISYTIPKDMQVKLVIYNLKRQKVKTLHNSKQKAGQQSVIWNGTDDKGRPVTSGIYFYKLITPDKVLTNKMIMLK